MYKAFIEPDLKTAQIKIINKFNPFAGFQNPTYVLKVLTFLTFLSTFHVYCAYASTSFGTDESKYVL